MNSTEQQAADEWSVADIIILLTPHLPDDRKPGVLARARKLIDPGARMATLLSLASVFREPETTSLCEEALDIAQQIESHWVRVRSLSEVYDVLPPVCKDRLFEEALASVALIANEWHKRRALVPLSRYLSDAQAERAAEMGRAFEDPQTRTEVLARFARVLPEDERLDVFHQVPALADETARVNSMTAFLPHLPAEAKNLALTWITDLKDASSHIQALTALGNHFPDRQEAFVQEALALTQGMDDQMGRMYTLMDLIRYLPEEDRLEHWRQVHGMVNAIEEASFRAGPLISLARSAPEDQKQAMWQEVLKTVRQIEGFRHATLLALILENLPKEACPEILDEILSVIQAE